MPDVTTLYRQLSPSSPELSSEVAQTTWEALLADPKIHVSVAERGEILGTVTLVVVPNLMQGARPYGLIENVVTREDVRGQGIGTALMTYVMEMARTLNVYKVMLVTGRQAPEVHRLYLKSGLKSDAVAYRARFDL
ncbi:GNAT family N-acetyltransferase [Deinococcus sp. QL22]|uniref:GNAT family N-acetyltransferase n=1 Tax=Deinococcus sp. QL22 TaxID=2939437 RepID=UPI002017A878|nr:GNAT family N-acetyltransferase [Deinococcus sp. QL22]UQN10696.1 GNAT family N-acetyltransferase [Deinococcus sp. QL22]UQN10706.1 GNAT family N-acetyltransferase [Deinococcus sp. QL22]